MWFIKLITSTYISGDYFMLIILTVCSILTGGDCREETMNIDAHEMTPQACIAQAQPAMADFIRAFPNHRVTRFKCIPKERREHSI
jgi:hypothetical protein